MKKLITAYIVFGLVFAMIISGIIALKRYEQSLLETRKKVETASSNLRRMKEAAEDIDNVIKNAERIIAADFRKKGAVERIFTSVDNIKSKMKDAQVISSEIEHKEKEIRIQIAIKALTMDYMTIVNNVGYLQSLRFPFFFVESISIEKSKDKDKPGLLYEIKGTLSMLELS